MNVHRQLQLADEMEESGQIDHALALYDQVLAQDPTHHHALLQRGKLNFSHRSEFQAALKDFDEYIRLRPNVPTGYIERSYLFRWTYFETNDANVLQLAIDDSTRAIELGLLDRDGRDEEEFADDTYFQRATAYVEQGAWDLAIDDLQECIRYSPTSTVMSLRGRAFFELRKYTEALDDVNAAIEIDGDDPESYTLRSKILRACGEIHAAEQDQQTARRLSAV